MSTTHNHTVVSPAERTRHAAREARLMYGPTVTMAERLREMAVAYAERVIARPGEARARSATIVAAKAFSVTLDDLRSRERHYPLIMLRQYAMTFTRVITSASWNRIGAIFNRDHTTAIHAFRKCGPFVEAALRGDASVKEPWIIYPPPTGGLDTEQVILLLRQYFAGATFSELSREFGVNVMHAMLICRRGGDVMAALAVADSIGG